MYYIVMALQETGEEYFVGSATSEDQAQEMVDAHLDSHPEHREAWYEVDRRQYGFYR